jgi:hypothetical protein
MKSNTTTWRSSRLIAASIALFVGTCIPLVGARASAATPCEHFTTSTLTLDAKTGIYSSAKHTVPSNSTCHDINIQSVTPTAGTSRCFSLRVRFYPTTSASYANSWRYKCFTAGDTTLRVIATDVLDGTSYRLESAGIGLKDIKVLD